MFVAHRNLKEYSSKQKVTIYKNCKTLKTIDTVDSMKWLDIEFDPNKNISITFKRSFQRLR